MNTIPTLSTSVLFATALLGAGGQLDTDDSARQQKYLVKDAVEVPVKIAIAADGKAATSIPDDSKVLVEVPIKDLIAIYPTDAPKRPVEPGKVAWHPSFEHAKLAALESGKPVMLFQLLGRLDDEFC